MSNRTVELMTRRTCERKLRRRSVSVADTTTKYKTVVVMTWLLFGLIYTDKDCNWQFSEVKTLSTLFVLRGQWTKVNRCAKYWILFIKMLKHVYFKTRKSYQRVFTSIAWSRDIQQSQIQGDNGPVLPLMVIFEGAVSFRLARVFFSYIKGQRHQSGNCVQKLLKVFKKMSNYDLYFLIKYVLSF